MVGLVQRFFPSDGEPCVSPHLKTAPNTYTGKGRLQVGWRAFRFSTPRGLAGTQRRQGWADMKATTADNAYTRKV
jgi:hypothetical protein